MRIKVLRRELNYCINNKALTVFSKEVSKDLQKPLLFSIDVDLHHGSTEQILVILGIKEQRI